MNRHQRLGRSETGRILAEQISIRLGKGKAAFEAVSDVSFSVAPGEFVCLLGPSGCGKSTLLGALAGHIDIAGGRLDVDGAPVHGPNPERGIVFQHHTLFPWKSARDNVAFGPKMRGVGKEQRRREAQGMLDLVGLNGFADRYPAQLSGGMQQRVEIARVLVNRPRLLLMDEPFGALDALTRLKMQELLLAIWEQFRKTILFVTHDIDEALLLADRIIVMKAQPGRIHEEITVPFARPRATDIVASPEFSRLKRHCLELLHEDRGTDTLPRLTPLGLGRAV
ncbi:NitT/TauT family transport system ATP-binding protein [Rhizobium leguminosarum]|uniref:NitT/TauT family transport system ATP-binding protein n=1 Tax=Rhizobium leguminosarum TaxID=384 RepID=A0AAE2MNR5_RHILE|nr:MULTISPECIES: ABC transporter ATP-binding protein [Rhizobium]MBB4292599.1 NitT/TauT family transport system ATP-binding protein [Rhizobium leguminosarum]MBB4298838.1 NitT/TauT family transport system ATP-binding protein [Rhizobium leguminosarum]MBB4310189.1 NitT/TauT family transport system ATP-binding protein [Rhizobium leguminosarum]MBB4434451.1 NitT/TauT family transport system ATP-binding protein [Rhizobium esperanzae]MBB4531347.1 NitT/TauT family transport system ATP-binding protein [R